MKTEAWKVEIDCEDQAVQGLRDAFGPETEVRFVERRNLSGDAATWMIISTLAVQALQHLLTFLLKWRELNRVKRIKIGNSAIDNPGSEDLERLIKMLKSRKELHDGAE